MNRLIKDYIEYNKDHISRYEIDLHLLQSNFHPTEIESVWQEIQKNQSDQLKPKRLRARLQPFVNSGIFLLSLIFLALTLLYWNLPANYPLRASVNGVKLVLLMIISISIVGQWVYSQRTKQTSITRIAAVTISIVALIGLLLSYLFTPSWTEVTNITTVKADNSMYHLQMESNHDCDWEDCRVAFQLYKCNSQGLLCTFQGVATYYNTYYRDDAKDGAFTLVFDPNTSKLNLMYGDKIFYRFDP